MIAIQLEKIILNCYENSHYCKYGYKLKSTI